MVNKRALIFGGFTIFLIILDTLSKYFFHWPFQKMVFNCNEEWECLGKYFPIFGDFFGIQLIYNKGIAFSLPIHGTPLKILTLSIILVIAYYFLCYEWPKKYRIIDAAFAMIFAGAISHAYERIFVGHVIDFLFVKNFAIFNFADILITMGAILLFVHSIYESKH